MVEWWKQRAKGFSPTRAPLHSKGTRGGRDEKISRPKDIDSYTAASGGPAAEELSMPRKAKPESPAELIDARIMEPPDWREEMLSRIRGLIRQAEP